MSKIILVLAVFVSAVKLDALTINKPSVQQETRAVMPETLIDYRWLHQHPELSKKEKKTAKYFAEKLREIGLEVQTDIGGFGILGLLDSGLPGPTILYRADMDGLPVIESTDLDYSSRNPGVMHACGHDVHMATALGALRVLASNKKSWAGKILFVGQPAEELGAGARAMTSDSKYQAFLKKTGIPVVSLAMHTAPSEAGTVQYALGWVTANVDSVDILLKGRGGHGAKPHETIDPIVMGADLIMTLQTIVSRRMKPGEPAVVTVGSFHAGTKHNIIASEARLQLTVRSYGDEARQFLLKEIREAAINVAKTHKAPELPEVEISIGTPAGFNHKKIGSLVVDRFESILGKSKLTQMEPTTGGEDFFIHGKHLKIPSFMWRVGVLNHQKYKKMGEPVPGLHSPFFAPDPDPSIEVGIATVTEAIREISMHEKISTLKAL